MSDRATKKYISENMQRRRCVTSNESGLVCVLENDSIFFYAANSVLDSYITNGATDKNQRFKSQPKRNNHAVSHIDTVKPQFIPVSASFNLAFDSYCAVWGQTDLHILTLCQKDGKVKSDLTVNLMLAAFGE